MGNAPLFQEGDLVTVPVSMTGYTLEKPGIVDSSRFIPRGYDGKMQRLYKVFIEWGTDTIEYEAWEFSLETYNR